MMADIPSDDLSSLNISSPTPYFLATPTEDESLPRPSSLSTEVSSKTFIKPDATQSFSHVHHRILYTHSFTQSQSFFDPTSSVPPTGSTSPPNSPDRVIPSHHIHKNLVGIILGVIGGSIALFFLALFTRQAIAFTRLPRQNMALTAAGREELVQEMVGYTYRRRRSVLAPPPPYERAPPYEFSSDTNSSC